MNSQSKLQGLTGLNNTLGNAVTLLNSVKTQLKSLKSTLSTTGKLTSSDISSTLTSTQQIDQDTAGYSGAGLRYGSTTNGVQTIDHDYTPSDDVSNVSATYGLTTEAAYSYWNEWDSLSDTQKSQIVRVRINFDRSPMTSIKLH